MDLLTIILLAIVVLLGVALAVILMRQGSSREAEQMRQQLSLALSQQAETVQRVERSLREQEQALSKVVQRAARPHREGDRPDRHRPARAAGPHRRGAEEDRRALDPGRQPAGSAVQQAGARRLRRGPAQRPGAERPAAAGLRVPVHAVHRRARRLPAESAQPAGLDRHRRQVPAGELQRAAGRAGGRRAGPAGRPARLPAGHPQAHRRHPRQVHRARRDRRIGADVPAVRSGLRRAARQLHRPGRGDATARASGSSRPRP